jgi:chromosome segregation ATPase
MTDRTVARVNEDASLPAGQMPSVFDELMSESRRQLALASRQLADRVNRFDAASALLGEQTRQLQSAGAILLERQQSFDASAAALAASTTAMEASRSQLEGACRALASSQRACDAARQVIEQLLTTIGERNTDLQALRERSDRQAAALEQLEMQRAELERWTRELHEELSRLKARRR